MARVQGTQKIERHEEIAAKIFKRRKREKGRIDKIAGKGGRGGPVSQMEFQHTTNHSSGPRYQINVLPSMSSSIISTFPVFFLAFCSSPSSHFFTFFYPWHPSVCIFGLAGSLSYRSSQFILLYVLPHHLNSSKTTPPRPSYIASDPSTLPTLNYTPEMLLSPKFSSFPSR